MRSNLIKLAFGLTFASLSFAHPTFNTGLESIFKRTVTPDNTCGVVAGGNNNNYTCDATLENGGPCCSSAGYCGNSTDYCGSGCQSQYSISGSCTGGDSQETCGPNNGGAVCSNSQCCSQSGYCGITSNYCADPGSCLVGYGVCDSDSTPAGSSTENAPRPLLGSVSYTDDIYDCVQNNVVALTYDDGPYLYTAQLLDTLKSYGFTATFFITGNNNGKGEIDTTSPYPDLIKRMIAEGHQVASHTWSHYNLSSSSSAVRISQMVKNEMAFNNIIGKWPTYMRPPYSECSASSGCQADMQKLGYHRVYFDLDTQDYLNPSASMIQKSKDIVKQQLAVSGVTDYLSIQHDIVEQSVTNLTSYYYDLIKAKGWKGVTVGACLGDPSTNWYRSLSSSSSSTLASSSSTSALSSLTSALSSSTSSSAATRTSTVSSGTTSKATITSVPTSKATSTTATSTSKPIITTTSAQPTATAPASAGCDYSNGKWCGVIADFNSLKTCNTAVMGCWTQSTKCLTVGGIGGLSTCLQWNNACVKLSTYCLKCLTGSCSNTGAGY